MDIALILDFGRRFSCVHVSMTFAFLEHQAFLSKEFGSCFFYKSPCSRRRCLLVILLFMPYTVLQENCRQTFMYCALLLS